MDVKELMEIRRANLADWAKENGTPQPEKSLFSQLKHPSMSFGERLARRLEKKYKMGAGFLDRPRGEAPRNLVEIRKAPDDPLIAEVTALMRKMNETGKARVAGYAAATAERFSAKANHAR